MVVEHDHDVIRAADHVVDLGPGAGSAGGEVLYSGPIAGLTQAERSATATTCPVASASSCQTAVERDQSGS